MIPSFLVRDRDRIIATHVCRHWRDTFLSTPMLWNTITPFNDPDKTAAYLERSTDVLLNVSVIAYGLVSTGWSASFEMLGQHSYRFKVLRVFGYPFSVMGSPFPQLTTLELTIPTEEVARGIEAPTIFLP